MLAKRNCLKAMATPDEASPSNLPDGSEAVSNQAQSSGERSVALGRDNFGSIFSGDITFVNPPPIRVHHLPVAEPDFTGRESEIDRLVTSLKSYDRQQTAMVGIHGLGGIGKTQLALKVASLVCEDYPDAHMFFDLRGMKDNPPSASEVLTQIIRMFRGNDATLPEEEAQLKAIYNSEIRNKRVLLVLDDAFGRAQVEPLLPPNGCALIVTCRDNIPLAGLNEHNTLLLEQFPPENARKFLQYLAPRVRDHIADEIADLCGFHPLALRAVGSMLKITIDLSPRRVLEDLRIEHTRLERIGTEGVNIGVEASFNLSYDRLSSETRKIFASLGQFIGPFRMFQVPWYAERKRQYLSEIVRRGLVQYNARNSTYQLHDLCRIFALSKGIELPRHLALRKSRKAKLRHAGYYLGVLKKISNSYISGDDIEYAAINLRAEWNNILSAWSNMCSGEGDREFYSLCLWYVSVGSFLFDLMMSPNESMSYLNSAYEAARCLEDSDMESEVLGRIGNVNIRLGKFELSVQNFSEQLSISRDIGNLIHESSALENMGKACFALMDYRGAIGNYDSSLVIVKERRDEFRESQILCNLGKSYLLLGEFEYAMMVLGRSLALAQKNRDNRQKVVVFQQLGVGYALAGDYENSMGYLEQGLGIAYNVADVHSEGEILFEMSKVFLKTGNKEKALHYALHAFLIMERLDYPLGKQIKAWIDNEKSDRNSTS